MPKESVQDRQTGLHKAVVTWGRDANLVQLATEMLPTSTASTLAELVESWDEPTREFSTGLYVTLSRKDINDLIRVLRRARDQAFGRDE